MHVYCTSTNISKWKCMTPLTTILLLNRCRCLHLPPGWLMYSPAPRPNHQVHLENDSNKALHELELLTSNSTCHMPPLAIDAHQHPPAAATPTTPTPMTTSPSSSDKPLLSSTPGLSPEALFHPNALSSLQLQREKFLRPTLISAGCLSTMEAEYCALSTSLKTLLSIKCLIEQILETLEAHDDTVNAHVIAHVFEDDQGALLLASNHRITNCTKYFLVKWHWFWSRANELQLIEVESVNQSADLLTKGLPRDVFEHNRSLTVGWWCQPYRINCGHAQDVGCCCSCATAELAHMWPVNVLLYLCTYVWRSTFDNELLVWEGNHVWPSIRCESSCWVFQTCQIRRTSSLCIVCLTSNMATSICNRTTSLGRESFQLPDTIPKNRQANPYI